MPGWGIPAPRGDGRPQVLAIPRYPGRSPPAPGRHEACLYTRTVLRARTLVSSLTAALALATAPGCKSRRDRPAPRSVAAAPADAGPVAPPDAEERDRGDKWKSDDEDERSLGGFQMFKEAWVYVDGTPIGVLREVELPPMPVAWMDEIESLDFNRGDPGPHERVYQAKRWRLSDYLVAAGVDLRKIKMVILHGGRGVVAIPGADFRRFKDGLRFDLTGNSMSKLRVFLPDKLPRTTSFDRYTAVSVLIDKPLPTIDDSNDMYLDGEWVGGIPYFGTPLRGGVRVYLDGRLALVIKRNQLGETGQVAPGRWNLARLLDAHGISSEQVVAADIVEGDGRSRIDDLDLASFDFTSAEGKSGKVLIGPHQAPSNAVMLYSKGKVPPVWRRAPSERYPDGTVKEP